LVMIIYLFSHIDDRPGRAADPGEVGVSPEAPTLNKI